MQDCMNTVSDFGNVREAVCVSTQKIMDACRDQDCMENVPVYLTPESQKILECATSVKARSAELVYADVDVEPVGYQDGYFCVNIQYYYRIIADAILCAVRPATIYGMATTNKRAMLFGGEGCARTFASSGLTNYQETPRAVVSAVDPVLLCAEIVDLCHCKRPEPVCCCCDTGLPAAVAEAFDDELVFSGVDRRLTVTLGQFSLVRLERETQLLIPSYDYCMPSKACRDAGCGCPEDPCEAFSKMQFPVGAFFPTGDDTRICEDNRRCSCSCGCGSGNGAGLAAAIAESRQRCDQENRCECEDRCEREDRCDEPEVCREAAAPAPIQPRAIGAPGGTHRR